MAKKLSTASAALNKLRSQLLNDLESEGQRILKDLTRQFNDTLQSQGDQFLQKLGDKLSSGDFTGISDLGGLSNLLGNAFTYVLTKPGASVSAQESERSAAANQQFRLSQSQTLAEAGIAISKGNKNL